MCLLPFVHGCGKFPENPNRPVLPYPIMIYPNTMEHYDLNFVSGWEYITSDMESTSRGIIVYRLNETEFLAYDRIPPNEPDACTDSQGNTTRLVVEFPFVVDRCNNAYYNILNGELIINDSPDMTPDFPLDVDVIFPLVQYHTQYDGVKLTIYN